MDRAAARRFLSENGWLARTPPEFRSALLTLCEWKKFKAGEIIYLTGDPPGGIYGICEGAMGMTSGLGTAVAPVGHLA